VKLALYLSLGALVSAPSVESVRREARAYQADAPNANTPFVACGGDEIGTWFVTGVSIESAPTSHSSSCPGMQRTARPRASGTLILDVDGTFADTTTIQMNPLVVIPRSCLRARDCAELEADIAGQPAILSVSCADDGAGGCSCSEIVVPQAILFSGRYAVLGTSMGPEEDAIGGRVLPLQYCVDGDTMRYRTAPGNGDVLIVTSVRKRVSPT